MSELNFKVTEERLKGVKLGFLRKMQGDFNMTLEYVARFVCDEDGRYLEEEDAFEILDEYTVADLDEIAVELQKAMETVVPKK